MQDIARGSLERIAQGVADPRGAAREALEELDDEPTEPIEEIRLTLWDNGEISVTHDRGETGDSMTVPTQDHALYRVAEILVERW